jgi:hypothetical protein
MQPCPGVHYLHPVCEALTDIISVCYSTLTSYCAGYSMRLPECFFGYYCAVACYWRFFYLHIKNGLMVTDSELSFMHQVKSLHLEVPPLIAHYLTGFGNTTFPSSRDIMLCTRKVPSYCNASILPGWFGRVSADTSHFTKTILAWQFMR